MPFANVTDFHDRTAKTLRQVDVNIPFLAALYGKPIAVIRGLAKEDLEGFAMLTDPKLSKGLEEARADVAVGRVASLDWLTYEGQAKL